FTLDKDIQAIAETALAESGFAKGAAVVLDAETSEILAMASCPTFSPLKLAESLYNENSPFLNRAIAAYSVGSAFKTTVLAAALEAGGNEGFTCVCDGGIDIADVHFNCNNRMGHGLVDMKAATALSCNVYFILLGQKLGAGPIINMAENMGFGREIELSDNFYAPAGILPDGNESSLPGAVANLSFGQGKLLASPLQLAAAYNCFANGGVYREPYLLKEMLDGEGEIYAIYKPENENRAFSKETADKIKDFLEYTVTNGTGAAAKPESMAAAGKTATAQSGQFSGGAEILQTWFVGFAPADKPKYTVAVMIEDGNSGSSDAAPLFEKIIDEIFNK
ncbi:MAG: penicillin-binding transpeptidase domain-containing protein, partial [Oscillospiraceae bacterium]|nr:penicillin-binding transpeptidase domain-containing protein [Oscillospiraceae bacterium]